MEIVPFPNKVNSSPSVTFESLTFSDGTTIELDSADVIVLVGPNNAGKSIALRELEEYIRGDQETKVFKSIKLRKDGTPESFETFLHNHVKIESHGQSLRLSALGLTLSAGYSSLQDFWPNNIAPLAGLFCSHISTETRITDSDPANAIPLLDTSASHPIHMLYSCDEIESQLSEYFRRAFGKDLIVFRLGGSEIPLLVGERLAPQHGEDRISSSYCERLRDSTVALREQGDGMRSFASVVIRLLAPLTPSILLLDEPEAFLHPPQARLLGELIASERSSRSQLFVATHSPDVLRGLTNVASENLRVLRMQRKGNVNQIKELDKELVREISVDPLMNYSSALSGVFHERVIVCESDADCMFYSSILDLPEINGGRKPDVLFVHAGGKDRIATLSKTLVELGVPVDVIADIDVINDTNSFRFIVESLGQQSAIVVSLADRVKKAVEQRKPELNAIEVKEKIIELLENVPQNGEFPRDSRSKIETLFRRASAWGTVKGAGESAIPPGEATKNFQELKELCKEFGLWIVPVGELEGFCKSVGGHGPRWVQKVIEGGNLAGDVELESARQFVREVWQHRYKVS